MMFGLEKDRFLQEQYEFESETDEYKDLHCGHGYGSNFINIPGYSERAEAIALYRAQQKQLANQ